MRSLSLGVSESRTLAPVFSAEALSSKAQMSFAPAWEAGPRLAVLSSERLFRRLKDGRGRPVFPIDENHGCCGCESAPFRAPAIFDKYRLLRGLARLSLVHWEKRAQEWRSVDTARPSLT